MDFPSRQTIHDVARVLSEWGITDFFKDIYRQNCNRFNIWCLELSKNTNLKVSNGCTKIVVKFGDDDWVIKIPYKTQTNYCHLEAKITLWRTRLISLTFCSLLFLWSN